MDMTVCCPTCLSYNYREESVSYTEITAPIMVGVNKFVDVGDPKYYTHQCTCLNCGGFFAYVKHNGETIL